MQATSLTIKVPGKLMVAGEYAVLEKHHTLVSMAVDRFVFATITDDGEHRLDLENLGLHDVRWEFVDGDVVLDHADERLRFVQRAMEVALTYAQEQGLALPCFSLTVKSALDDESGIKYGLGSSAAVTTAVVAAILQLIFRKKLSKYLLFRLAFIAHVRTQGNGSGADIAASVYGGMIEFTSPQADWLLKEDKRARSLTDLVEQEWPYASIAPVQLPDGVHICVGWTGSPASTFRLVDKLLELKETNRSLFDTFLRRSEEAVQIFLQGMKERNVAEIYRGVEANRMALAQVGVDADVPVETPLLEQLSADACSVGGVGKLSGAGGGDCGIAFLTSEQQKEELFRLWKQSGIKPLPIQLTMDGATDQ